MTLRQAQDGLTLREAKRLVETKGIAPLTRVWSARPGSVTGPAYARFIKRRNEVEDDVAEALRELGAEISLDWDSARFVFCGIETPSAMGFFTALKRWREKADSAVGRRS